MTEALIGAATMEIPIALPVDFQLAAVAIGPADDRHACGRQAAHRALIALGEDPSTLAYEGTRPVVRGATDRAAVSITHGKRTALAVAARVDRLGIDLCDDDPRLAALAQRFLVDELALVGQAVRSADGLRVLGTCFAAKEAALKALGKGLVDGGVLDGTAVRVTSLDPPRLSEPGLTLAIARLPGAGLAVVYG